MASKKCLQCGCDYKKPCTSSATKWAKSKYCCNACKIAHLAPKDKVCANCDATFNKRNGNQTKAKYCSEQCRKEHYNGVTHPHHKHGLTPKRSTEPGGSYYRNYHIFKTYGITGDEFQSMYDAQAGKCAICLAREATCVDHDHDTGDIRGLLCRKCNSAIGIIGETPELLDRAAKYLRRHKKTLTVQLSRKLA